MSPDHDPCDADRPLRLGRSCGAHARGAEHAAAALRARSASAGFEATTKAHVEAALAKALFPQDALRRRIPRAVGRNTAMGAIGSVLPVASLQSLAQGASGAVEK